MRIDDQVCEGDEASVDDTTRYEIRKATAIGQVYQVCATQVHECYVLERATRGMRCLWY